MTFCKCTIISHAFFCGFHVVFFPPGLTCDSVTLLLFVHLLYTYVMNVLFVCYIHDSAYVSELTPGSQNRSLRCPQYFYA